MYKNILDAALVFCLVPVTFTVCHNLSTYSTRILSMLNKKPHTVHNVNMKKSSTMFDEPSLM